MIQFVLVGAAALAIVALALSVASRRVGEREAIVEARSEALVKAQGLVEPVLTDALLDGDPDAIAAVDEVVQEDVLTPSLVRVKIWDEDGTILYSDEPRLIGATYPLGDDEMEAFEAGVVDAEVSDLSKPENRYERKHGKLLEVYLPITTPSGQKVLFEAYFLYDRVEESGLRIWRSFAPIAIGALIVLELIQIPLAYGLARRLRIRQLEREELMNRAINASEHERRRIAQDLHDGVVQDLAGVSYSLAALARDPDQPQAAALAPDIVLMDLSMPGTDGIEATRAITAAGGATQVVVLTSFSDKQRILDALDAGAAGYVLKHAEPDELLDAIRAAHEGGSPLDPKAARVLLDRQRTSSASPTKMSEREQEVLRLVAAGLPNKTIARQLGIAERTVKAHLTSIFQRIGVTDRTQAALWARDHLPEET